MGGGNRGEEEARRAREEAQRAYEMQRQQLELQRQQLEEMKKKEARIEAERQAKLEGLLKRKRTGRLSTILTDWETLGLLPVTKKSLFAV